MQSKKFLSLFPYIAILALFVCNSCSNKLYTPLKKYSAEELREDFDLMRNVMQDYHPSLYWYTPKDSMDKIFDHYRNAIKDSMNEQQFGFSVLAPVTTSLHCGHTSFNYSKKYNKIMQDIRLPQFPLYVKVWGDTMLVTGNLNRKDSVLKRGTQINSIDGRSVNDLTRVMFRYLPIDGYSENLNYLRLSSSFPYYHRNIFGINKTYTIGYTDSSGNGYTSIPVFDPYADSVKRKKPEGPQPKRQKITRKDKMEDGRSFRIDTAHNAGIMSVNTFEDGYHLNKFYRRSFKTMRKNNINNLVVDIRSNGGGKVNHFTALARYMKKTPFKVADTAFTLHKGFGKYHKYFQGNFINGIALTLFTTRKKDGLYHFNYWENHRFKPRKKNFYAGNVYMLINGPTFSAGTLFAHAMKGQDNVILLGEEAGGGNYGNNGLIIPNIVLPNTGMRVRMPLFRIVQHNPGPKDGRGVMPDIYVPPTSTAVRNLVDRKMQVTLDMMKTANQ
jgi:hypothetical protein